MVLTAATLAASLTKVVALGADVWGIASSRDHFEQHARLVQDLIETAAAVVAVGGNGASRSIGARHLVLVTSTFGEAFKRHWLGDPNLAPTKGFLTPLTRNAPAKVRAEQIERCVRVASVRLLELGSRPLEGEFDLVSSLVGDPVNTPYYRPLWDAFTDPQLVMAGEEPLIIITAYREFERLFRLVYNETLSSNVGEEIRRYLMALSANRPLMLLELLARQMATWGSSDIFNRVTGGRNEQQYPLERLYVEPLAVSRLDRETAAPLPIFTYLDRIMTEHDIVIVRADFGHGKSLSARLYARNQAVMWLEQPDTATSSRLPIFIKCSEDFSSEDDSWDRVVRRALWRQARSLGLDLPNDDPALTISPSNRAVLFFVDGFDEVVFGDRELRRFFDRIREMANRNRKFVIFTRPAALPGPDMLKGIPILDLQPLSFMDEAGKLGGQVGEWIAKWATITSQQAFSVQSLAKRGLLEIAQTPILLFMIATGWTEDSSRTLSLSQVYYAFFYQMARGKYEADRDQNRHIAEASDALRARLVETNQIPEEADAPKAMLWLMARVAWKAKCLEDADLVGGRKRAIAVHDVQAIIREEVSLPDSARLERTIQVAVLLALQASLEDGSARILFGHKSFREFLIARYWSERLGRLAQLDERGWEFETDEPLLDGRLLGGRQDEAFRFFKEEVALAAPAAKAAIRGWAQRCFDDVRAGNGGKGVWSDRRFLLREAAIAIGSIDLSMPMRAKDANALRGLLSWFWMREVLAVVIAPGLVAPKAALSGTKSVWCQSGGR